VVICEGGLISIENGAEADIAARLSTNLIVSDFRFKDEVGVGRAVGYRVSPGKWAEYHSKDYYAIAATNRILAAHISDQSSRARLRFVFILIFSQPSHRI
jgi:hypothetical protein